MRMNVGRTRIASVASPVRPRSAAPRPRALFVGGARYDLPLSPGLARKWNAVGKLLEFRVIGRGGEIEVSDPRFRLTRGSRHGFLDVISHAELARVVASEIGRFRPDVVITQSPFEALAVIFATARLTSTHRPKLVVELHGDWRTAARLYGGRWRRPFAKLADRGALLALRRADGIRAVSPRTADLAERTTGRRPLASFPAFVDLEAFSDPPTRLPKQPSVAWIGVLEEPKDPLLLAAAWRAVAREVPDGGIGRGRPRLDAARDRGPGARAARPGPGDPETRAARDRAPARREHTPGRLLAVGGTAARGSRGVSARAPGRLTCRRGYSGPGAAGAQRPAHRGARPWRVRGRNHSSTDRSRAGGAPCARGR